MTTRLQQLTLTKVALVPQGANPDAHIVLYKSAEGEPVVKDALDMGEIEIKVEIEEASPAPDTLPLTTAQRLEQQALVARWWPLWDAFSTSMYELMDRCRDGAVAECTPLLMQSIQEFQTEAQMILQGLGLMAKAAPAWAVLSAVAKAGRVMSAQRMTQLKTAIGTLQTILQEAGGAMEKGRQPMSTLEDVTKRADAAEAEVATLKAALAKAQQTPEQQEADYLAGLPESIKKKYEADQIEKAALKEELRVEKEKREQGEYIQKTADYRAVGLAPDDWDVLKAVDTLPEKPRARVLQLLKAAGEQLKKGALFSEKGHSLSTEAPNSAGEEITALVQAEVAKGVAYGDALSTIAKGRPDLYHRYTREIQQQTRV